MDQKGLDKLAIQALILGVVASLIGTGDNLLGLFVGKRAIKISSKEKSDKSSLEKEISQRIEKLEQEIASLKKIHN